MLSIDYEKLFQQISFAKKIYFVVTFKEWNLITIYYLTLRNVSTLWSLIILKLFKLLVLLRIVLT